MLYCTVHNRFNSSVAQFKPSVFQGKYRENPCFNSYLVRLKTEETSLGVNVNDMFQFLYGSIQTLYRRSHLFDFGCFNSYMVRFKQQYQALCASIAQFQFLYGAIQTRSSYCSQSAKVQFQFLYGAI